jgi:hypothetical protein
LADGTRRRLRSGSVKSSPGPQGSARCSRIGQRARRHVDDRPRHCSGPVGRDRPRLADDMYMLLTWSCERATPHRESVEGPSTASSRRLSMPSRLRSISGTPRTDTDRRRNPSPRQHADHPPYAKAPTPPRTASERPCADRG